MDSFGQDDSDFITEYKMTPKNLQNTFVSKRQEMEKLDVGQIVIQIIFIRAFTQTLKGIVIH